MPRGGQPLAHVDVRARQPVLVRPRAQHVRRAARGAGRGGHRLRDRGDLLVARRGAARRREREEDEAAGHGHGLLREQAGHLRRPDGGGLRQGAAGRGRRHRRHQLPARPGHHAAADRGDAQGRQGVRRLPARGLPDDGREAGLHQPRGVPVRARPAPALAPRDGPVGPAGARPRHRLHRLLLRLGRDPRPRDGAGARQAARRRTGKWNVDYSKPMSAYEYYKHEGK